MPALSILFSNDTLAVLRAPLIGRAAPRAVRLPQRPLP